MIEPAFVGDFGIAFAGKPEPAVLGAVHAVAFGGKTAVLSRPVGFASPACLIAYPTSFAAHAPEDALGAYFVYGIAEVGDVVICFAVDAAGFVSSAIVTVATVSSVKPHFELVGAIGG